MMDYEVFKQVITERISDFLPPVFRNYKVRIQTVRKVNQRKEALLMTPGESGDITALPNIYLDDMYAEFKKCQDLDEILRFIASLIVHYTGSFCAEELNLDFKQRKDSIVINLINTQKNKELLATVPHKDFFDLSIIYRFIMEQDEKGIATVVVTDSLMKELGLTLDELDSLAGENTRRLFPAEICSMSEYFYIMTNEAQIHGAATMVFPEALHALAEKIGSDFFLIPSSIHEILAVKAKITDVEKLLKMLEEGNRLCVEEHEILSSSIYYYDRAMDSLTIAGTYHTEELYETFTEKQ